MTRESNCYQDLAKQNTNDLSPRLLQDEENHTSMRSEKD